MIVNLKDTFNNVVTMYDAARPTYPLELLNDIKDFAEKSFFTRGLEIGAGTGQATDCSGQQPSTGLHKGNPI